MTKMEAALSALTILGGFGITIIVLALLYKIAEKRKFKLSTKTIEGKIIRYIYPGDGRIYPIVQYVVDNKSYKVKKRFRGVKLIECSGKNKENKEIAFEDEEGWLNININKDSSTFTFGQEMIPVNTKVTVYYNPNKPKQCFVEKPDKSTLPKTFIIIGSILIVLGFIFFFLINK